MMPWYERNPDAPKLSLEETKQRVRQWIDGAGTFSDLFNIEDGSGMSPSDFGTLLLAEVEATKNQDRLATELVERARGNR